MRGPQIRSTALALVTLTGFTAYLFLRNAFYMHWYLC